MDFLEKGKCFDFSHSLARLPYVVKPELDFYVKFIISACWFVTPIHRHLEKQAMAQTSLTRHGDGWRMRWSKRDSPMEHIQVWSDQETKLLQKPFQPDERKARTSWNCPGCHYLRLLIGGNWTISPAHQISWWYCILNKDNECLRRIRSHGRT